MKRASDLDEFERPLRPLKRAEDYIGERLAARSRRAARRAAEPDVRESVIEKKVVAFAVARSWLVRKLQWIGRNGAPDRVFMRGGRLIFVEFKQRGRKPTPIQLREHQRMREAGMEVHVIDSIEAGYALFG